MHHDLEPLRGCCDPEYERFIHTGERSMSEDSWKISDTSSRKAMPDNNTSSNKRTLWKKKWRRKKNLQATVQNYEATGTNTSEPCTSGEDFSSAHLVTIKTEFHPRVSSYHASEGSSSQAIAGMPHLHQKDERSVVMQSTVVKLENNSMSNKRTGWKKKWKKKKKQQETMQHYNDNLNSVPQDNNTQNLQSSKMTGWKKKGKKKKKRQETVQNTNDHMTSTHHDHCKPDYNGAFTLGRTIENHPRVSSDCSSEGSSSQATAHTSFHMHSQVHASSKTQPNCEPTTSTPRPPPSTSSVGPPNRQGISADFSRAVVGLSKQSSVQRAVSLISSTQLSTVMPSKYLAIDCEMVGAGPKGHISQLARCSIVSFDGDVVYDKFIKPPMNITDYRTRWSGIRARDLYRATPYAEARKEILKLVKGKVLIGHAIHNDLKVLGYSHPKDLIRDTSRIPLLNVKAGFNEKEVVSLKRFTKALFNRDIQAGWKGHSSVEDAKATMELYKVVEVEWERTLASTAKNHQRENK